MVRRVLSGEEKAVVGWHQCNTDILVWMDGGLPCSCVNAYTLCPSHGAFSWVPFDREAADGHLCGLTGVYVINCRAGEGARAKGGGEENLGEDIQGHAVPVF